MSQQAELRKLPSVDKLLASEALYALANEYGHSWVLENTRVTLAEARQSLLAGGMAPSEPDVIARIADLTRLQGVPSLQMVINATGVILHTNLGRALLSDDTIAAMTRVGSSFSNLEYDLASGQRGSRYVHAEDLLIRLTGAEAALLVNNNAAAVLLVLAGLARDREVIISRSQLVEIGGGFRIPDVLSQSGARLVEVGTTNRTYLRDYQAAITPQTAAILRVHQSNFKQLGFVHQPSLAEMAGLAHDRQLLMFDDLGSGTLLPTEQFGLPHEPTIQESIAAGADLVTFSGDKLLGGPQSGIIVGRKDLVGRLREFPLTRALRVDKTTIAGVQANLLHYARNEALTAIPVWQMMSATVDTIAKRAQELQSRLGEAAQGYLLKAGRSMIGGGALPEESLPTMLLVLPNTEAQEAATRLRRGSPPVVARVEDDRVVLDLRTVLPGQEEALVIRLRGLAKL
ncbi:MAG: L-seryl-tRNA(Sec) selenium transferase [Anaerolineae bacterium]